MISVIMPTYNRFEIVEETIQKVLEIKIDIPFELIVVNDGEELPFSISHSKLQIFKNPKKGVSHARNYGASLSKYPILFFIDDDMWITGRSLEIIIEFYQKGFLDNSYFNLNWVYPEYLQQKLKECKIGRYILHSKYHTWEGRSFIQIDYSKPIIEEVVGVGSCSFCLLKKTFQKIGGYNENINFEGEDIDISQRLVRNKITAKLATEITCYHNQQDRLEIDGYLDRIYRGYFSQAQAGMAIFPKNRWYFYSIILPLFSLLKIIYYNIPNRKIFDPISFRLIGSLCSLSCVMAIRDVQKIKKN
jgi:glycosyltransferase involved in cell wall biosynthesis